MWKKAYFKLVAMLENTGENVDWAGIKGVGREEKVG